MASANVLRAIKERGVAGAFFQFFKLRTFKFGKLVGVDAMGNHYYENAVEYPHGMHRWVEHSGNRGWFEIDASEVTPEWHGWLHGLTDDPPTTSTVGSVYQMMPQSHARDIDTPYTRNLGGVVAPHLPNQSQRRPRGYGTANSLKGPLETEASEEHFWTQPGWVTDPRHQHPKKSRSWSLKDTTQSLLAERERMIGSGTLAALDSVKKQLLTDGEASDVAVASATASAEISGPSSSEKLAAVYAMRSEEAIRAEIVVAQGVVDEYSAMRGFPDAEAAVERAEGMLVGLEEELAALRAAQADAGL